MASIIKCDTLQLPDGSTPTAADLGIDVAGTILQAKQAIKTDTQAFTTTNWTDVSSLSIDITPVSSTSKFVVVAFTVMGGNYWSMSSQYARIIYDSSTVISANSTNSMPFQYGADSSNTLYEHQYYHLAAEYTHGSTGLHNIKIQIQAGSSSYPCYVNRSSGNSAPTGMSSLIVYEIEA